RPSGPVVAGTRCLPDELRHRSRNRGEPDPAPHARSARAAGPLRRLRGRPPPWYSCRRTPRRSCGMNTSASDLTSRDAENTRPGELGTTDAQTDGREVISLADQRESAGLVARTVVPLKHWGRWVFSALIVFVLAQLVWTLFTNPQWRWGVFAENFFDPAVIRGLWLTLWLTLASAIIGFALGAVLAIARMSRSPLLSSFAWGYIWFFRSIPLVVQLVIWYNLGYLFHTVGLGTPF